jgi:uncharacterized spore protein YtfJ
MELHHDEVIEKITDFLKTETKTETVIGTQFELGEFKCVPVIKTGMGFGSGTGSSEDRKKDTHTTEGMGAGAGVGIEPIGFLVTKGEEISFIETGKPHGLSAAFEKVPELIEKIYDKRTIKEEVPA